MKLKYLVVPGFLISKNDGDEHWIGAADLIRLYGVDPRECFVLHPWNFDNYPRDLIELWPKYNSGNYKVPKR